MDLHLNCPADTNSPGIHCFHDDLAWCCGRGSVHNLLLRASTPHGFIRTALDGDGMPVLI